MKNKLLKILLTASMVMSLTSTATATSYSSVEEQVLITAVTEFESIEFLENSEPTLASDEQKPLSEQEQVSLNGLHATAVREIYGFPLVVCHETGVIYLNEFNHLRATWYSTGYQSTVLEVKSATAESSCNRLEDQFESLNDGNTYSIYGWAIMPVIEYVSPRPSHAQYTPTSTSLSSSQSFNITTSGLYKLPLFIFANPSNTSTRYYMGINGTFNYFLSGNTMGHSASNAGIVINSDK